MGTKNTQRERDATISTLSKSQYLQPGSGRAGDTTAFVNKPMPGKNRFLPADVQNDGDAGRGKVKPDGYKQGGLVRRGYGKARGA